MEARVDQDHEMTRLRENILPKFFSFEPDLGIVLTFSFGSYCSKYMHHDAGFEPMHVRHPMRRGSHLEGSQNLNIERGQL
jgi:hypothetical protein